MSLTKPFQDLSSLLFQPDGKYTRELLLKPGRFGLGHLPGRLEPDAVADLVCGYCSTGCSLRVHLKEQRAVNLTPSTDYPVNLGMACPKGWEAVRVLDARDRATTPLLRDGSANLCAVDWDTALNVLTRRFKGIQAEHGAESVAFLSTGQIATEEMALLGAVAKFGMGMRHGDGNTRQCMATSVVAYKESFGFDAPPYTYADFEESDVIVLVGANLCIAHPILWERVVRNSKHPEIVVVDPRRTETAMQASEHLPIRPKSDQHLFYSVAHVLIQNGWVDADYVANNTCGFEEFAKFVERFAPKAVSETTGLDVDVIEKFAATIHAGKQVSFWWTMGVNQSHQGVRTAQSIINLALLTGNMGRPGTGANSITGQCNAMGSRLFSNTTNLLGGHDFTNAAHRAKVAQLLGLDTSVIPDQNSWAYNEIMEGILAGKIRGLWVIATNPAHSWINQSQARDILDRLDFLVVQDMYHTTETARMADLVLPAAGWGEKEGTFINSERRIGTLKRIARSPGLALSDFAIFKLIAEYWGCGSMFQDWESPEAVFKILKRISQGQPCDISGIEDYAMLDRVGGVQWPCPAGHQPTEQQRRLFEDGKYYHGDQRARIVFEEPRPLPERPSKRYPFVLLTGRGTASQWHTQTRTSKSAVLRKLYPAIPYVEINPTDANERHIEPNDWVIVESQRGRTSAKAYVTRTVRPGQVFLPMHYETVNQLTDAVFDPYSKQPSYKACAVAVSKSRNG